ncbi:hypothetical protein sce2295 [Sorangium cellulosum So ce56]|uniref:Secreted protein n=2 Tax=Sorangium cellulosum TaxID=56 RepID=A9G0Z7_SORC5|nr:hypothetical protein sce2295 [Sorangium cellulosum So ce56]
MLRLHLALGYAVLMVAACGNDVYEPGATGGAAGNGSGGSGSGSGTGGSVANSGEGGAGGSAETAGAGGDPGGSGGSVAGGGVDNAADPCGGALPITCGDRLNHSTTSQGRANVWTGYDRTARAESGRETVYAFSSTTECMVVARLENLATDLDLLLLSACDPIRSNEMASSTPLDLQTVETVSWTSAPGQTSYLVVDGYAGAEGSYTLSVDCACR